jgi:hypothetical protein
VSDRPTTPTPTTKPEPTVTTASSPTSSSPNATDEERPRQRGIRAALVSVAAPEPSPTFWDSIEGALDDQDQLEIVTRPAVRSITEPPPISQPTLDDDPRHGLAAYRPSGARRLERAQPRSREDDPEARRRRLAVVAIVVAVLAVLGAASVLGGGNGPINPNLTPTTANPAAPVEPGQPANPQAVPGLDPATPLTAAGIGPVQAGMTLGELQDTGATYTLEQSTYDASGGTCFDVSLPGASDLTLRFRSPEAFVEVSDPREGILASINIDAGIGSTRLTETGIGLGATEEQLRAAQAGLEVSDHPSRPGWFVYLARAQDGSGMGVAYVTDGSHVTEISVGEVQVVNLRQTCA